MSVYVCSQFDVQLGALLSCFGTSSNPPSNLCLLQELAPLVSKTGEPCMNQSDSPLLIFTYDLYFIPDSCFIKTICTAHHCTQDCKFVDAVTRSPIEREPVTSSKAIFSHDLYFFA